MKILYINALYSPLIKGGAEISLKVLVEGMQARGHEVVVLSLKPEEGLIDETIDGVKVYRAGLKNSYWPFYNFKPGKANRLIWHIRDRYNTAMRHSVRKVIEIEQPDIVSCHNLVGWSVAVWDEIKKTNTPLVQVLHDLYLLCPNSDMYKENRSCDKQCFQCSILRNQHRALSNQVNAVVGISKFILKRFTDFHYFQRAKKYVIYNSRNIPESPIPEERKIGQSLRVGYIGTLAEKKGVEWLINQFNKIDADASLVIAGGGQKAYEAHLRATTRNPKISFVGYVDPAEFYKQIDVLVVPSLWQEPLGMVAIEALAYHVPVIANAIGGLQETVLHDYNGLLCRHEEQDSLGQAIQRILQDVDLYNHLMKNARASVSLILSQKRMIDEYLEVLYGVHQSTEPK